MKVKVKLYLYLIKQHFMKTNESVSGQFCVLATLFPGERAPAYHLIRDWVGMRTSLDVMVKKIIPFPYWKLNHGHLACS
jgi:hypothetical protein